MPLQLTCTTEQKITVRLHPITGKGNPASLDGKPTWSVADGMGTLNIAEDGLSAELISPDEPGITQYLVKADADLGEGVDTISDTIELTASHPNAQSLGLTADAPVDK